MVVHLLISSEKRLVNDFITNVFVRAFCFLSLLYFIQFVHEFILDVLICMKEHVIHIIKLCEMQGITCKIYE